jgi:nucleoid-associated protein YgaU
MRMVRRLPTVLPPVLSALLLSGCSYVHFGKQPPATAHTQLVEENSALRQQIADLAAQAAAVSDPVPATALPVDTDPADASDLAGKLATALRSFSLLQEENTRLQSVADQLASEKAALEAQLAATTTQAASLNEQLTTTAATARLVEGLRTQLRQTQDQLNALIAEYSQLRTRFALGSPAPGTTLGVPTRPGPAGSAPSISEAVAPVDLKTAEPRTHTVLEGETLSHIARRYYGDAQRWPEILQANRTRLADDRSLRIGMKLLIP